MRKNRIPTEKIKEFLITPSRNRNAIVNYVKDSLDPIKNTDKSRSLALCFRGDYATVYYRCHQLLRIRNSRNGLIGEFDFRHSRFTKDYAQKKAFLENEYGVNFNGFEEENKDRRYARFSLEKDNPHINDILDIFKSLIDDFLDKTKTEYCYDIPQSSKNNKKANKSQNIEKDAQQSLYAKHFRDGKKTYYDVEYAEHLGKYNGVPGRFDMLGIKRNGEKYALVFTEIKSTAHACSGEAGIEKHEGDYFKYANRTDLTDERKTEACEALKLLGKIFDKHDYDDITPEKITDVIIEFVFTDKAVKEGENYNPKPEYKIQKIIL